MAQKLVTVSFCVGVKPASAWRYWREIKMNIDGAGRYGTIIGYDWLYPREEPVWYEAKFTVEEGWHTIEVYIPLYYEERSYVIVKANCSVDILRRPSNGIVVAEGWVWDKEPLKATIYIPVQEYVETPTNVWATVLGVAGATGLIVFLRGYQKEKGKPLIKWPFK